MKYRIYTTLLSTLKFLVKLLSKGGGGEDLPPPILGLFKAYKKLNILVKELNFFLHGIIFGRFATFV